MLADEAVREFLQREGYALPEDASDCDGMLRQLSRRLCCEADFPHEIGVFLGYPLTDVVGFIENQGRNFTCCGCWKAYGDPDAAARHFAQLNKCTRVYLRLFHEGTPFSVLLWRLDKSFSTNTLFYPGTHRNKPRSGERNPPFDTRPSVAALTTALGGCVIS